MEPDIKLDIAAWEYWNEFVPGEFQVVACSPPCTEFSRAKTTATRDLRGADRLVKAAIQIIMYLKPATWWIENPRHGLHPTRHYMNDIPYVDADY